MSERGSLKPLHSKSLKKLPKDLGYINKTPSTNRCSSVTFRDNPLPNKLKSKQRTLSILPETAAKVAKEYLLPMFQKNLTNRGKKTFKTLEPVEGTVLSEIKLSEQLAMEVEKLKKLLSAKNGELEEAQQKYQSAVKEVNNYYNNYLDSKNTFQINNFEYQNLLKENQNLKQQLKHSKTPQKEKELTTKIRELEARLGEERSRNHKLDIKVAELEHGNSLLSMHNQVIGERLKGLTKAIESILGDFSSQNKLKKEVRLVSQAVSVISNDHLELLESTIRISEERNQFYQDSVQLLEQKTSAQLQSDKLYNKLTQKINNLQEKLNKYSIEKEELQEKNTELTKNLQTQKKYTKTLKATLNNLKRKSSESRQCIKCGMWFIETKNFQWSCKTHAGNYSEESGIYFCCGKKGKESGGCITSTHMPSDDEDSESSFLKKCKICTEDGHKSSNCPRSYAVKSEQEIYKSTNHQHLSLRDRALELIEKKVASKKRKFATRPKHTEEFNDLLTIRSSVTLHSSENSPRKTLNH